jgi:GNAT superfamily N-acetyltransferase
MTKAAAQRLTDNARIALQSHFLTLPTNDLRLRFGTPLAPESIAAYVARIDFDRDAVFGIHDDALVLIGAAHVAFGDDTAELGISVLPDHRGRGAGSALFERAAGHVRNRFVSTLFMHCLSENATMMHIARRAGMDVVVEMGEADARLTLPPASPASIAGEFVTDRLALYDYALKANAAVWKGINAALAASATAADAPKQRN